jgi:phage baseplate assembly protein W
MGGMPLVTSSTTGFGTGFAQVALSLASDRDDGLLNDRAAQLVTDVDDIQQEILIVLFTPLGADVHRPDFGSDWWHWIDSPVNVARPHIVRAVVRAIERWVVRIQLVRVVLTQRDENDFSSKELLVEWKFAEGVAEQIFSSNVRLDDLMASLGVIAQ